MVSPVLIFSLRFSSLVEGGEEARNRAGRGAERAEIDLEVSSPVPRDAVPQILL